MKGRKPKPTAQKLLEGNPGKRPLNEDEPKHPEPDAAAFDVPPEELAADAIAAAEWKRLAPMLRKARQVTEADRNSLIALCLEWSRYLEATRKVRDLGLVVRTPTGYPMTNPYLPIATKALQMCNRLWPELGLTPSSRSRVKVAGAPELNADDPFAEFDLPSVKDVAH